MTSFSNSERLSCFICNVFACIISLPGFPFPYIPSLVCLASSPCCVSDCLCCSVVMWALVLSLFSSPTCVGTMELGYPCANAWHATLDHPLFSASPRPDGLWYHLRATSIRGALGTLRLWHPEAPFPFSLLWKSMWVCPTFRKGGEEMIIKKEYQGKESFSLILIQKNVFNIIILRTYYVLF